MRLILGKNLECFREPAKVGAKSWPRHQLLDQLKPACPHVRKTVFFLHFKRTPVLHSGAGPPLQRIFYSPPPRNKRIGHRIYGRIILFPAPGVSYSRRGETETIHMRRGEIGGYLLNEKPELISGVSSGIFFPPLQFPVTSDLCCGSGSLTWNKTRNQVSCDIICLSVCYRQDKQK